MRVVPKQNVPAVSFFESHLNAWALDPAGIGLTPDRVAHLADLTAAARAAYIAQQRARIAARSATNTFEEAMNDLRAAGSACLAAVRAHAADDGTDAVAVYARAQIPPPADPAPIPAPGRPEITAQLHGNGGALRLTWRCKNPPGSAGTLYEIRRTLTPDPHGGAAGGGILAVVGAKRFLDYTLPPGTHQVTYSVTALRSTRRGLPGTHTVKFGNTDRIRLGLAAAA
jgi:hypothetical protein